MNNETSELQDECFFKQMEIVTPTSGLSRPAVTNFDDITDDRPCTIMNPVNIDIIITPCDSSIKNPYEYSTLSGKTQKTRSRWSKRRPCIAANWISSHLNERRLRCAAANKNEEELRNLIEKDVDLNLDAADDKQRTALHISAANGCQEIVRLLLQNMANPNVKDMKGNSPLHLAACSAKVPIITLLLSHGADLSAVDFNGQTPLHLALARLKIFKNQAEKALGYNALKVKADVKDIADLLKEYIGREGSEKEQSEIIILRNKLQSVNSEHEIDEIGDLLFDFTQMAINSSENADRKTRNL